MSWWDDKYELMLARLNQLYLESPRESWDTYTEGWKDGIDNAMRIMEDTINE